MITDQGMAGMSTLIIERPPSLKDVDLLELFQLRIKIGPAYNQCLVLPTKQIIVGERGPFYWEATEFVITNGLLVYWPKETTWHAYNDDAVIDMRKGDALEITLTWYDALRSSI